MSEEGKEPVHHVIVHKAKKPWYRHWWGVILAICIWPFLLLWYAWAKAKWKKPVKIVVTVAVILFCLGGVSAISPPKKAPSNNVASDTSKGSATTTISNTTTATSNSTAAVSSQPKAPSCTTYQTLDSQTWLEIVKDPDSYKNQCFTVYGDVTQFDSATGTNSFRADVGGVEQTPSYGFVNYPTNTYLTGSASTLNSVVEQDLFTANVMVLGSYSYQTQIGGQTTVPKLQVNSIQVTGSLGSSSTTSNTSQ